MPMLAIQAGNGSQGIDKNSVTVHKGIQSCFIIDISRNIHKVCCSCSISSSISGNLGDFSQLKLNSAFVINIIQILNPLNNRKLS